MVAAASPLVAAVDHVWSANASDPDNILTNEVHFTSALADIPHEDAISLTATSDMTVRMPAGSDWSAPFGLKFYTGSSHALTLDFADAMLSQPNTTSEAPYKQDGRFNLGFATYNVFQYAWDVSHNLNGAFRIEGALLTITNNINGLDSVDFWRGTWDFLSPNSTTNAGYYLYIAAGASSSRTFHMNFHEGSELRAPIFFIYGAAKTNEISVLGGSHYMANLQMRVLNSGGNDTYARTRFNIDNENSWLYYTEWFWYIGWREVRFELLNIDYTLSNFGKKLKQQGERLEDILHIPRAVDFMEVHLKKRFTNFEEKIIYDKQTRAIYDEPQSDWSSSVYETNISSI